ncbi:Pretoxin HINT domain-containing protein [Saccharopolyspora antimicrobica]|uniref:Pretoxin HINT domain-containing protein n=1 Tax=Saccharopolyspora antimicrobica TaxID=455193 RepID=A0A1I4TSA0_9PSEU|nr:polymorphic toxin-type HINT domain-containing protein [Saccharopolyspora antimicrobica]RKT88528.1 pretoxin HINT domain-containing protein [Saccharopolyspora antimicrobica]SFM79457.1 Pretoxin HINT domain-containing protein [Saccharopolyspora antimicrobica]
MSAADWAALGHTLLDIAGLIPAFGAAFGLGSYAWYGADGAAADAALSCAAAVPVVGDAAAVGKLGSKLFKGADAAPAPRQQGVPCAPNSFVPGTLVLMADGSHKPIEEVDVGEVLATDPETGETGPRRVLATITGTGEKNLVEITIDTDGDTGDATGIVTATDEHPFWVDNQGRWINAEDLTAGADLYTPASETVDVTSIRTWSEPRTVHNLTINGIHTYYVLTGEVPVLVHNAPPGTCSITTPSTAPVINSKTVYTAKDRSFRVDIENQNPGQPGAGIHLQFMGRGADPKKYYYDPADGTWRTESGHTLSPRVVKQVPQRALDKAYQYFGMEAP